MDSALTDLLTACKISIEDDGGGGSESGPLSAQRQRTKTCDERQSEMNEKKLSVVRENRDVVDQSAARAAFMENDLWPPGSKITIGFISNDPPPDNWNNPRSTHFRTPTFNIIRQGKKDDKEIDPLQNEVTQESSVIDMVKRIVVERINPLVNLEFEFIENAREATIRISFDPRDGAYAYVGKTALDIPKPETTMNLGWFDVATTIHEFCHALGMVHEHQNPQNGINWAPCKVFKWAKEDQGWDIETTYENILKRYDTGQVNGSVFDKASIMLYFFDDDLTTDGKGTRQNLRMSPLDVEFLSQMYMFPKESPKETQERTDKFYLKCYNQTLSESFEKTYGIKQNQMNHGDGVTTAISVYLTVLGVFLVIIVIAIFFLKHKIGKDSTDPRGDFRNGQSFSF